ncbi:MAG: hypothetical protein P8Y47_07985 [Alphaproteobacteria bacterium]
MDIFIGILRLVLGIQAHISAHHQSYGGHYFAQVFVTGLCVIFQAQSNIITQNLR